MLKKIAITITSIVIPVAAFIFWFSGLLPDEEERAQLVATQPEDLSYLGNAVQEHRGKILAVVTSTDVMGSSGKSTGYELTELSRAYYVFQANGFEVDIASPKGGKPPVVIDGDDMGKFDYAFLNDEEAQYKVNHSIPITDIQAEDYRAVYFVGGKGAMFDFPDNTAIQNIVRTIYEADGVVGAVCHGPAALVNVTLDDGSALIADKNVSSFTNEEELFLIPEAESIFPFLLEDQLVANGARFDAGLRYLEKVSHDGNLITGQNPWSVWKMTETMISQLGYTPIEREITSEENTVDVLYAYETQGFTSAWELIEKKIADNKQPVDVILLAMHGIVAAMDWEMKKLVELFILVDHVDDLTAENLQVLLENTVATMEYRYMI